MLNLVLQNFVLQMWFMCWTFLKKAGSCCKMIRQPWPSVSKTSMELYVTVWNIVFSVISKCILLKGPFYIPTIILIKIQMNINEGSKKYWDHEFEKKTWYKKRNLNEKNQPQLILSVLQWKKFELIRNFIEIQGELNTIFGIGEFIETICIH